MRPAIRRSLAAAVLLAGLGMSACVCVPPGPAAGPVHHVVLCWLKTPGDAAQRAQLVEVSRGLSRIEHVASVSAGTVRPSERPVVDDSFDVAIHMTFATAAALEAYEADPRHVQAVKDVLGPLTAKVVVYDFVE